MTDINTSTDSMNQLKTPSNYGFSTVGMDVLAQGASEYTLSTILVDASGSVAPFAKNLEKSLKTILGSCKDAPRADNLLLRLLKFSNDVQEIHGFRLLADINPSEYDNILDPNGGTALFDAVTNAAEATGVMGANLAKQDIFSNGVIYVITDGENNSGTATAKSVLKAMERIGSEEKLQSMAIILIMVGADNPTSKRALEHFKNESKITQFVDMTELFKSTSPEKALAKLAGYISRSISTTSVALASGNASATSSRLVI